MSATLMETRSSEPVSAPNQESIPAKWARRAFAALFLAGSASHFVFALTVRDIYRDFAAWSPFGWVRDAWSSVFMPYVVMFALLLALFELATGVLILGGGKRMQLGLLAAIGFHLGLMLFGLWPWSVPMIGAFAWLLYAERRRTRAAWMVRKGGAG